MSRSFSHSRRCQLDRLAYPRVRHAATKTSSHNLVDGLVGGIGVVFQQRGGLHDLSRLAITALRNLQLDPGGLQWMSPLGVEPLDRRYLRAGARAERGNAGSGGAGAGGCGAEKPLVLPPQSWSMTRRRQA